MAADFSLEGKVAVVTGGARGLGLEMMRALAEAGAAVASIDLLRAQGEEAARGIARAYGVRAAAYTADVTDAAQCAGYLWYPCDE
jgi:sorbose reductase